MQAHFEKRTGYHISDHIGRMWGRVFDLISVRQSAAFLEMLQTYVGSHGLLSLRRSGKRLYTYCRVLWEDSLPEEPVFSQFCSLYWWGCKDIAQNQLHSIILVAVSAYLSRIMTWTTIAAPGQNFEKRWLSNSALFLIRFGPDIDVYWANIHLDENIASQSTQEISLRSIV